jgi:hypothetical protein
MDAPERGPGNAYLWTRQDMEQASWVLRGCSLDRLIGSKQASADTDMSVGFRGRKERRQ